MKRYFFYFFENDNKVRKQQETNEKKLKMGRTKRGEREVKQQSDHFSET